MVPNTLQNVTNKRYKKFNRKLATRFCE